MKSNMTIIKVIACVNCRYDLSIISETENFLMRHASCRFCEKVHNAVKVYKMTNSELEGCLRTLQVQAYTRLIPA